MNCILCGQKKFDKLFKVENAIFSQQIRSFNVIQCINCELARMDPFPAKGEIEELYVEESIYSHIAENPFKKKMFGEFLEKLYSKYGEGSFKWETKKTISHINKEKFTLLDIGCNNGRFLEGFLMNNKCADLNGIDLDSNFSRNYTNRINFLTGDFMEFGFDKRFDLITMRYLLEHLSNFKMYVEKAVSLLNDEGIIYAAVPDIGSAKAKSLKDKWNLVNDSRKKIGHVMWFTQRTIKYIADKYSLKLLETHNTGELISHLPIPLQSIIRNVLGVDPFSKRPIKNYQLRILYAILFDNILPRYFNYGDCIHVWFRK